MYLSHLKYFLPSPPMIIVGLALNDSPVLQYIYYLSKVGISVSPLAEDALYCPYEKNPFVDYFKRGLNISLSTDNPVQLHISRDPLMEEYSIASKVSYRLYYPSISIVH